MYSEYPVLEARSPSSSSGIPEKRRSRKVIRAGLTIAQYAPALTASK
jgi:hypothetical protein